MKPVINVTNLTRKKKRKSCFLANQIFLKRSLYPIGLKPNLNT